MLTFAPEELRDAAKRIFVAKGAPADIAEHVAWSLVESNLAGHDSHGVIRITPYVQSIDRGSLVPDARPETIAETSTTATVKGNWGFGQVSATYATDLAIGKAKEHKLAAVAIVQGTHIGRLGEYAERIARANLVSIIAVGGFVGGIAAPPGGVGRALGTNPLCFGFPAESSEPMVADFATTIVAEGKVAVLRAKGQQTPEGWILDKDGNPTTNPEDLYSGGTIKLVGEHKGYGLSMAAEALSSILPGIDDYRTGPGGHGTFILAIDPEAFRPFAAFAGGMEALFERVKSVPKATGFSEVLVPGEPEARTRAKRTAEGIPVPEEIWGRLVTIGAELGVELKKG